jgi:hypothetical protein
MLQLVSIEGRLDKMQVFVWINPSAWCDVEHLIAVPGF